jgi:hypothetical protein
VLRDVEIEGLYMEIYVRREIKKEDKAQQIVHERVPYSWLGECHVVRHDGKSYLVSTGFNRLP